MASWLIMILVCLSYSALRIASGDSFESNILSLMPVNSKETLLANEALQSQAERKFVILLSGLDKEPSKTESLVAARALRDTLRSVTHLEMKASPVNAEESLRDYYKPYRYQLLSPQTRHILQSKSALEIAELRLAKLYSPIPDYSLYSFSDDPLNIGGQWLQSVVAQNNTVSPGEIPSVVDHDITWYILAGELQQSPFNLQLQQELIQAVNGIKQQYPQVKLLTSGLVFHAIQGSKLARQEISTVGLGSGIAVFLLVILVFRSFKKTLFILTVLGCSTLIGLSMSLWVFGQVHLVTLAFGSTLLGLAADYCFHFLVKLHAIGNPQIARKLLFKGLIISVVSSVLAYLIQLLSPFPGLQQFAVFVASGLAAACFTVLVLATCFKESSPKPVIFGLIYESLLKRLYSRIARAPGLFITAFTVILILAMTAIYNRGTNDDIRLLNTSGNELLETERKVGSLLNGIELQRYFLIKGQNLEQVLQRSQRVVDSVAAASDVALVSVGQIVPSVEQQREDYALVQEKLFSTEGAGPILCEKFGGDCEWLQPIPDFNAGLGLTEFPMVMLSLFPQLALLEKNISVVFFRHSSALDLGLFKSIELEGVSYIDRVESLSNLLRDFRVQVSWLLLGFLGLLGIVSYWLFSRESLVVLGAVIGSSVMGVYLAAPLGITLFHILALLLVIGIAVDTAVFFITPGLDRNTWAAATLACLTSIIAFGLLSASQVPLLNQFGQVVVYGLLTSWIITPAFWFVFNQSSNKS
jgi:predicted exporter